LPPLNQPGAVYWWLTASPLSKPTQRPSPESVNYNFLGIKPEQDLVSSVPLRPGKQTVGMEFIRERTGEHGESLGRAKRYVNDKVVVEGPLKTQPGKVRRALDAEQFDRRPVVLRRHHVPVRLLKPGLDQRLQPLGIQLREVFRLGAIDVHVIELPLVLVEVSLASERHVDRIGEAAVLPDTARAEHRVVLALLLGRAVGRRCIASRCR